MKPTDFKSKSLSWVGNIYQTLETLYNEIDNNIQDTVRFVEGQVHNVGENMKKLYSDVIQDLFPLSCENHAMAQESSAANGSEHCGNTEDLIPRSCYTQTMAQESTAANGSEHHGITEVLNKSLAKDQVPGAVKNNQCDAALRMYSPDGEKLQNSYPANDLNHATTISDSDADEADCTSEVIDGDEVDSPSEVIDADETAPNTGMETIDLSDKVKDDDGCVIVDNSLLYEVPLRHCGKKSYKKKIQDAFSPKRRLVKEYKMLAIMHGDLDVVSRRESLQSQLSSKINKASDAEWEIL